MAGKLYMAFAGLVWVYYTVWQLVTPIVDADHPIQDLFPSRESGLLITTFCAYLSMAYIATFAGLILIFDKRHAQP